MGSQFHVPWQEEELGVDVGPRRNDGKPRRQLRPSKHTHILQSKKTKHERETIETSNSTVFKHRTSSQ
jgi:hypothetical protein